MRSKLSLLLCLAFTMAFVVSCAKKDEDDKALAKVGSKTIRQSDVDAFTKMQRMYPSPMRDFFPGKRSAATFLVETEALYRKAKSGSGKIKRSADWQWKKRYFPAQLYITDVISKNMGYLENDINKYYEANKDSFKVVARVRVEVDTAGLDSAAKAAAKDSTKDSTYYRSVDEVRNTIVEALFLRDNDPEPEYYTKGRDSTDTSAIDTPAVQRRWLNDTRKDLVTFYLKKEYQSRYGGPMPDSLNEWYGEGKIITPTDLDVVLGWLPEGRRESYTNESGTKYLAEWLLKWKIFSDKAGETNFSSTEDAENVLDWAWKLQAVSAYIEDDLLPKAKAAASVDTAMCIYSFWDNKSNPDKEPDSSDVARVVENALQTEIETALSKRIYEIRSSVGVEFLQSDWKDDKGEDPAALMAEADSLLGAGESRKAESIYTNVRRDFSFTEDGLRALNEMAKIQTEKGNHRQAIQNYRQYLISSDDEGRRCNTFFMIGFIYDEYMNKPRLAEVQYKWILKNTPECELADDAEFMALHLDEPMTSVEELQAEARRQGRKIDDTEPATEVVDAVESTED